MQETEKPKHGQQSVTEHNLSSEERTCLARSLVGRAEVVVYVIVAALLLIAAVVTCCFALVGAVQQFWSGKPLEGIFSFLNDLLLVLIIMEVLRTVARFIRENEFDIDVADVIPFLVIGAISAARRILAIGAKLSLGEAQPLVPASGSLPSGGSWYRFDEAMIELGVDAGLILAIAIAVLIIHRYTLGRRSGEQK
jgi:uncharacterized membrane protein (DUF373 family)